MSLADFALGGHRQTDGCKDMLLRINICIYKKKKTHYKIMLQSGFWNQNCEISVIGAVLVLFRSILLI